MKKNVIFLVVLFILIFSFNIKVDAKGFKKINNKIYYYENETNIKSTNIKHASKKVIDVSVWQGNINWNKVKSKGKIYGAIIRLGYSGSTTKKPILDKKFIRNIKEVQRLKIPHSVYYYGYNNTVAGSIKEADFVVKQLKNNKVNPSFQIFYDAEVASIGLLKYTKVIPAFINRVQSTSNYKVGVYGNLNALTKTYLNSDIIKKYPIWVAQYSSKCSYKKTKVGWQYTSSGKVEGIKGRVDLNIWF